MKCNIKNRKNHSGDHKLAKTWRLAFEAEKMTKKPWGGFDEDETIAY